MRKIGVAVAVVIALFVAFNVYYFLPRGTIASITKTEVQRREKKDATTGADRSQDVLLIYAADLETGDPLVFRNEDNIFYFKVDSSDIASQASKIGRDDPDGPVLIKYYGVRMPLFSAYPNVISLKQVPPDYEYVPWGSMIILVILLVVFIWGGVKIRRMFQTAKQKITGRPGPS